MHIARRTILGLLALLLLPSVPQCLSASVPSEYWYILEMQGKRSGWMHTTEVTEGDRITLTTETKIKMKRGPIDLEIIMNTESVETVRGEAISMTSTQKLAGTPTTTQFLFGDEITIVNTQGGRTSRSTRPLPEGSWLPPAAASRFIEKRMAAGADPISVRTIDPTVGIEPILITRSNFEDTTIDVLGKRVPATRCTTVTKAGGVEISAMEFLDPRGVLLRTTVDFGGLEITTIAAERELALADVDPPELMQSTFVHPDRAIPNARRTSRASYVLHVENGVIPDLPQAAAQRVERINDQAVRVTVDLGRPLPAPVDEVQDGAFSASSVMINATDSEIQRLAEQATQKAGDEPAARAEAMRRFVHRYIDAKSLGVGFATASETARTREGDCSEHGALLAALLRADGIPSRVASGVIYADAFAGSREIFGYHMWSQALLEIDGEWRWVDLDATLPRNTPTDATHIAIVVTPLADGELANGMFAIAPLLGTLQITVESFE